MTFADEGMGWFSGLLLILGTAGVIALLGSASPTLVYFPVETFQVSRLRTSL